MVCLLLLSNLAQAGVFTLKGGLSVGHQGIHSESGQRRAFFAPGFGSHVEYLAQEESTWRIGASSFALVTNRARLPYIFESYKGVGSGLFRYVGLAPMIKRYGRWVHWGFGPLWSLHSQRIKLPGKKKITTMSSGLVFLVGIHRDPWYWELSYGRQKARKVALVDQGDFARERRVSGRPGKHFLMLTFGRIFF